MAGSIVVSGSKLSKTVPGRMESFYKSVPVVNMHFQIDELMEELVEFFEYSLDNALSYSIKYNKID